MIGLRSYPEEVQSRVRSDPQLAKDAPKEKSTAAILLSNLLLFTVVFSVLGLALKNVLSLNSYMPCAGRGIGTVRLFGDRSALVAQYQTHSLFMPAGKEILSGPEKAYCIIFARNTVVHCNRRAGSPDRHAVLNNPWEMLYGVE